MLATPVLKPYGGAALLSTVAVEGRVFKAAERIQLDQPAAHAWDVGAQQKLQAGLAQGEVGIVVFEARARPFAGAAEESAAGEATVYIQDASPPNYEKAAMMKFHCTAAWQTFYLSFTADKAVPAATAAVSFQFGGERQILEIGPVSVLSYGRKLTQQDLPRTAVTYPGRELDAPWRKAAEARILAMRMGSLVARVVDAGGHPLEGARVSIRQLRNAFGFGSAVTAQWLMAKGDDGEHYRKVVGECFSRVVFENDLKMEMWEGSLQNDPNSQFQWKQTQQAADWLKEQQIPIRGHYLSWAPWEPWSEKLRAQPEQIKARVLAHLPRVAEAVGDRVIEWDAINHLAGWDKNIDEATGLEFYSEIMRTARAATKLPLWVNEDQVFRPGRQQEDYFKRIKRLMADGCRPDGIGNQAHFDVSFLPSPMDMLANSDRFAALVPALQITEFDVMAGGDEALEADYLRDCLLVCYSHPAYTGFLTWGFWAGAHWKPEAALWRKDWSEKPAAKVWRSLVCDAWATHASGVTSDQGEYGANVHLGLYEITVESGGKTQRYTTTVGRNPLLNLLTFAP